MKYSAREDLDTPIEALFEQLVSVSMIERAALRRGIALTRTGNDPNIELGEEWTARISFRGKPREIVATVAEVTKPERLVMKSQIGGMQTETVLDLVQLSPKKTRAIMSMTIAPKTLAARILVQSMKLTKSSTERRFKKHFSETMRNVAKRVAP